MFYEAYYLIPLSSILSHKIVNSGYNSSSLLSGSIERTPDVTIIAAAITEQAANEAHIVKNPAALAPGRDLVA